MSEIWQEMDCPVGADMDLSGDEMLFRGQSFRCGWCGGEHVAGETAVVETYVVKQAGESLECLGLPADAEELARWRKSHGKGTS